MMKKFLNQSDSTTKCQMKVHNLILESFINVVFYFIEKKMLEKEFGLLINRL